MIVIVRRSLAVLSACGVAVSIIAYMESMSGATLDDILPWMIVLGLGAIAVQIPMFVFEYSSVKDRTFFWKRFARDIPRWVVPVVKLFWLIAVAHFAWSFIVSHHGVPIIKDGQFLLSNHGRIMKVLTQQEYLTLRAADLRVFAALMIACYLAPMMYWWFARPRLLVPGNLPSAASMTKNTN